MGSIGKWELRSNGDGPFQASVFYMGGDYITSEAIAHELGHNLGLPHASTLSAVPVSLLDPTDSGVWMEAGDAGDLMGSATGFRHFSTATKSQLSWLDPAQILDVTGSGDYSIDQVELPSAGFKALRVPVGKGLAGADNYYWVEYRTPGIFDQEQAVQVRFQADTVYNGSSIGANTLSFTGPPLGASLSGRVTREADGTPIMSAYISLYDSSRRFVQSTYTDGGGRFAFKTLSSGGYYLRATYSGEGLVSEYYDNAIDISQATLIQVGQDQAVTSKDIALALGGLITGTITDQSDGTPIPSAYIYATRTNGSSVQSASTDSSGHYTIQGLPAGQYLLESYCSTGSFGFQRTWYIDALTRTGATPVTVDLNTPLTNMDFSMMPGGSISGRIVRSSDQAPLQGISVYAYDRSWNFTSNATTGTDGSYTIKGLATGAFFVRTYNSQGYTNKYYNNVTSQTAATSIQVTQGSNTAGIDFALEKSSLSAAGLAAGRSPQAKQDWVTDVIDPHPMKQVSPRQYDTTLPYPPSRMAGATRIADGQSFPDPLHPTLGPWVASGVVSGLGDVQAADVTSSTPFVDPFRGIKIELLGTYDSGAAARANLRITLTKLRVDVAQSVNFGQLPLNSRLAKEVNLTNGGASPISIGNLTIAGRNPENFQITNDQCSGASLAAAARCKVEVSFVPVRYSGSSAGEFAVLKIPTNDGLQNPASVALWGKVLAPDLYVSGSAYDDSGNYLSSFTVGKNVNYSLLVGNTGTTSSLGSIGVTVRLGSGQRYVSSTGTWGCTPSGQEVNCSRTLSLSPGSAAAFGLTVAVTSEAFPLSITRATVSNSSDANSDNNTEVLAYTVIDAGSFQYGANLLKGNGAFMGVAFMNASTATAALTVTSLDSTGTPLQSTGATNPARVVLKPGEQLARLDDEIWGLPPADKSKMSWFRVDSAIQKVVGLNTAFDGALQMLDGAVMARSALRTAILPEIAVEGTTRIHVLNTSARALDLTVRLLDAGGNEKAAASRRLNSSASLEETLQELFAGITAEAGDYVRIDAPDGFAATECMTVPGRWMRVLAAQDGNAGAQVLYASQYASGPTWKTAISIVNLGSASAQITARLFDDNGAQKGQTILRPIRGNGKVLLEGPDLFLNSGTDPVSGYVEITSDSSMLAGSVAFGDPQSTIFAALPLQAAVSHDFVYGQAAFDATWYTGVALVNPNSFDIAAKIHLCDKSGNSTVAKSEIIKARGRVVGVLSQFFPSLTGVNVPGGYIRVTSESTLVGFAVFGTWSESVLSAIPPQAIR